MPNWCHNDIEVRGKNKKKIKKLISSFKKGQFCNAVIPIPEELRNPDSGSYGGDNADEKHRLRLALTEKYGYSSWYDFCVAHWGTKWDVGGIDEYIVEDPDGYGFKISFQSAWNPPLGVSDKLHDDGFSVTHYYSEPGMMFVGKFKDGFEEEYHYSSDTHKTVRAAIGDELDDRFGISDMLFEEEKSREEEEDLTRWVKEGIEKNKVEN